MGQTASGKLLNAPRERPVRCALQTLPGLPRAAGPALWGVLPKHYSDQSPSRAQPPEVPELLSLHNPVARAARALVGRYTCASRAAREGLYWFSKCLKSLFSCFAAAGMPRAGGLIKTFYSDQSPSRTPRAATSRGHQPRPPAARSVRNLSSKHLVR